MTNDELKAAFMDETPVMHGGIQYLKVSAIIYRKRDGKVIVDAELLDKNRNSVTIADPKRVEEIGGVEHEIN